MFNKLFEPGKIGKVGIKNRLVMSPMGCGLANLDGTPSEDMIAFYEARAIGGAGLIIPEITRVNDVHGAGLMRQLSVTKNRHIEPLSKLAEAVHKHGSKIFIQLHHPGRETVSALLGGQPVVAPSPIPCKYLKQETRELKTEEVKELISQFIDGAVRVQKAGCDGVELHAAHGYLLQQFLSPYTNKREDEYGGSFENRLRMIQEIIVGIRKACGPDFPIGVRLSVEEFLEKTGVTEEYIHIQDGIKIAMALEEIGIDFIDVSCGLYETGITSVEPISFPQGWRRDMIMAVKNHVNIPVIGVSAIKEPTVAEKFLEDGVEDFVSMGRTWLADENWGKKVQEGREKEIRRCVSCLRCFESLNQYNAAGLPPECSLNPRLAKERRYGDLIHDTKGHTAVVVGGGPAGMCAAQTLASRGVKVTLIDRQGELGGTVNLAKKPPLKERMQWIAEYYQNEFERLGVEVKLNTEATADMIMSYKPDAVIVATGSTSIIPNKIPGVHGNAVYTVEDVLTGEAVLQGKKVAVIGAGLTGLETAEYLCTNENQVVVIDMQEKVAPNANHTNVADVCGRLAKSDVQYMLGYALKEIHEDCVILEKPEEHMEEKVSVDAVVLSLGYRPDQSLVSELEAKGVVVKLIGSAIQDGAIAPAVRTGYEVGRELFVEKHIPSFRIRKEELANFGKVSLMDNQEGIYISYLTDPAAIARILPPPLKPFSMPVVTLSVCHVNNPTFADDYYEAILGVYATYGKTLGLYPVGLVLGGPGAEMAVQCGRDNGSIPKKLGAEFVIRRNGDTVTAGVTRRGTQLVEATMKLGEYNSPLTAALYQFPAAGKQTFGGGFYFHIDREPDEEGVSHFKNASLLMNQCEYNYQSWEPGLAALNLKSSVDDPWAELPINTIIGGAYSKNSLLVHKLNLVEKLEADEVVPYLLTGRYDRTAFMETGRI
ncbi:2,4-dienoyl-CoA reductase [Anaerosporobacter mobilis DSM 15930]|jgi:2,4-dienoyl-CoA reductase-like NADH-dependent reductase (Old Yellow Enzyme family)/NADPH-dependent 2,4-dienoyl-CoA reductase/sulfur reductase-like enzyme/acetoacetate decarboxylase|uniref:2,4-dienoyl-CoA reductase n=2 Tax=Anaerosporobacter TaxID=653683 RepID=A0A1M7HUX0_9FIRM|nr:acetoacetate decarboxylase family protein [Anaerosporobacter mobilis]SHM32143.1 2,4-dienoyl-CoA reductase [Anaerosporobacter mobilis DSM 15930]